jgi:hypothetical protein
LGRKTVTIPIPGRIEQTRKTGSVANRLVTQFDISLWQALEV